MAELLMPKATAVWLVENTALTFDQIADFCGLHVLEVQAIADGEVAPGMQGLDPIANGQLLQEEVDRCATDPSTRLVIAKPSVPLPKARQKGARYTPISKRQDRPDAIAWMLRTCPELSDAQICRLIGTTKPTINSVRDRTHRNISNIKPQSPVYLGLCSAADLEKMVVIARARAGTSRAPAAPLPEESENANPLQAAPGPVSTPEPEAPRPPVSDTPTLADVFPTSNTTPKPAEPEEIVDPFAPRERASE